LTNGIAILAAIALSLAGVVAAWQAWRVRRSPLLVVTLLCWVAATTVWCARFGAEIGIPLAIETGSLVTFAFILSRIERRADREAKERTVAPTPLVPGHRWRGTARAMLAGPLGFIAAIGIGAAIAIAAPWAEQTRLILAGLIVPSLWAAFMIWSIAAERLWRPALCLAALTGAGFAIALMPKG